MKYFFIPRILHDHQNMLEASPSIGGCFLDGRREKVAWRWGWGVRWMWCVPHTVLVQILYHCFFDVWLGIVSAYHQFSSISCIAKSAYLWKNKIKRILTRPLLTLGQDIDQVEPIWIPHHGQYCFHTADHLAFICWGTFMVREPDVFVLIREIKRGFLQRNKLFPTLVPDGMQHIQEMFRRSDLGLFLSLR
jgi:hypothetical protein